MKDFFKPYHFEDRLNPSGPLYLWVPEMANKLLNAEIEKWPVVYARLYEEDGKFGAFETFQVKADTHTARLAFMEEVKPKECEHEPTHVTVYVSANETIGYERAKCHKCNKKLKAIWSLDE